jgi:hypothetical protein
VKKRGMVSRQRAVAMQKEVARNDTRRAWLPARLYHACPPGPSSPGLLTVLPRVVAVR